MDSNNAPIFDSNGSPITNGRFSSRAARFYWADDEPSPRAHSIQTANRISSSDTHFEESPLVIASISAGIIGVAIIIIILVGLWIRSRLFSEEGRIGGSEHPHNASVQSSMSTLDEDAYAICMEMNGTVLGGVHNNYCATTEKDATTIEMENECECDCEQNDEVHKPPTSTVPADIIDADIITTDLNKDCTAVTDTKAENRSNNDAESQ